LSFCSAAAPRRLTTSLPLRKNIASFHCLAPWSRLAGQVPRFSYGTWENIFRGSERGS
jgi:hypothetical protein